MVAANSVFTQRRDSSKEWTCEAGGGEPTRGVSTASREEVTCPRVARRAGMPWLGVEGIGEDLAVVVGCPFRWGGRASVWGSEATGPGLRLSCRRRLGGAMAGGASWVIG